MQSHSQPDYERRDTTHDVNTIGVNGKLEGRSTGITTSHKGHLDFSPAVSTSLGACGIVKVLDACSIATVVESHDQPVEESRQDDEEAKDVQQCRAETRVVIASSTPLGDTVFVEELERSALHGVLLGQLGRTS